jgi:hypothetical protein
VYATRRKAGKRIEEPSGKITGRSESREEAAAKVGVSSKYVTDAERIQREAPEVFDEVKAGRLNPLTRPAISAEVKPLTQSHSDSGFLGVSAPSRQGRRC